MDILLQRLDDANDWQPFKRLALAWRAQRTQKLVLVVQSALPSVPAGAGAFAGDDRAFGLAAGVAADHATIESLCRLAAVLPNEGQHQFLPQALPGVDLLALKQLPPTRLLLLGAGPDAQPVAELSRFERRIAGELRFCPLEGHDTFSRARRAVLLAHRRLVPCRVPL